jgi:ferric-dicitrate binding protein FerR (iron transport regulator)
VLGTAFNVRSRRGKVSVDVVRGLVKVRKIGSQGNSSNNEVILKANQGASYRELGGMEKPHTGCTDKALSWQHGKLAFQSEPLSEILNQLEDYYPVLFKLNDASLAGECLTGSFENHGLDEILNSILTAFDLKAEHLKGVIILNKQKEEKYYESQTSTGSLFYSYYPDSGSV